MSVSRSAFPVALALLVLGTVLRAAFLLWHPPFTTDFFAYDDVLPYADTWFLFHVVVGAPGFAALFIGLAAITATLTRDRGGVLAVTGGVIAAGGGLAFALGLAAEGALYGWLLDPAVIDADAAAALLRSIETGPALTSAMLWISGGIVMPAGVLLQLIALAVSRTVPLWLPAVTTGILLLTLVPVPALDGPRTIAESLALLTIAAFAWRYVREDGRSNARALTSAAVA